MVIAYAQPVETLAVRRNVVLKMHALHCAYPYRKPRYR
jgi:hypothetical protein